MPKNKIRTPQCGECRNFCRDANALYQGMCAIDKQVVREIHVCSKLPTDRDRSNAKAKNHL